MTGQALGWPRDFGLSMWSEHGLSGQVRGFLWDLLSARCLLPSCREAKQAVGSMSLELRVKAQLKIKTWEHWNTEGS